MIRFALLVLCSLSLGCSYVKVIFQKLPDTAYPTAEARAAVLKPLDPTGVARWREANGRIVKALEGNHPDPWFRMSREAFMAEVARLDRDLPGLSEYQVVLRWNRILAALGDGHTQLWERASWQRGWPIEVAFAGDSLLVTEVANGQEALLGARILRVSGEPLEDWLRRLEPFLVEPVPSARRLRLARVFEVGWAWLEALGELPQGAEPIVEVEARDGRRLKVRMETVTFTGLKWRSLPAPAEILRDVEPNRNYAFRLIQDGRTLYFRYRRCRQDPAESMGAFLERMQAACEGQPVARILVDLRGNGGGSERVVAPVMAWIRKHPAFSRPGGTLVLVDGGTYSSGHGAASRMKMSGALIAGVETGQPVNGFGEIHFSRLPGLKPAFACSLRRFLWDKGNPAAWRQGLKPDLPFEPAVADVLGISDSVLDRLLATPFPPKGP